MEKLPRIIDCEFSNIYGEKISGVLVPMSSLTREKINNETTEFANKLKQEKNKKIEDFIALLEKDNNTLEDLRKTDTRNKAFDILMEAGKFPTEEDLDKYIKKHSASLVNNKTKEELIEGIATKTIELELKTNLAMKTIGYTLFYSLRTIEDKRKKIYETCEMFLDEVSNETIIEIYNTYNKDIDVKEEEIKN